MQKSNISRYLSEDEVFGYLASDDKKEEEINNPDWISTDNAKKTGKSYFHVIYLLKKK